MMSQRLVFGGILGCFFVGTLSFATPSLQTAFVANYPFTRGTQLDSCTTCHMPAVDGFLNPYGIALRDNKINFKLIENLDSDGDGVSNIDEIKALTFPGSHAQYPEYFIFPNSMGEVHFNHEAHVAGDSYISKGRCANCHGNVNLFPKRFNSKVSIKVLAHQICWRCHEVSGSKHAPTECTDCHKK